jgi:hypothetical protein
MLGMREDVLRGVFDALFDGEYDEARAVLDAVVKRLPNEARAIFEDPELFAVGTSDLQFNASSIRCENGGWAIILDRRLISYYFLMCLLVIHCLSIPVEMAQAPELSSAEAAGIAAQVVTNVRSTGLPLFDGFRTEPVRTHFASDLAVEAHRFVLSHELAHIALGHVSSSRDFIAVSQDLVVSVDSWSQEQEWEADLLALRLELGPPPGPDQPEELAIRYAGCQVALDGLAFFEDYSAEVLSLPVSGSHPPAAGRLARVRAAADESCENDIVRGVMFGLADEIAHLLDSFRTELGMLSATEG